MSKEMEKTGVKTPNSPVTLVVGWGFFWILFNLLSGDWFPGLFSFDFLIGIPAILVGIILLIWSVIVALRSLLRWALKKERLHVTAFRPLAIILVLFFAGNKIPSKTAMTFYLNHDEFIRIADSVPGKFRITDGIGVSLPQSPLPRSPLYKSIVAHYDGSFKALVVEFIVGNHYLPLVYISTDNPGHSYDTCSEGGAPRERLEAKWYVCRRDWN